MKASDDFYIFSGFGAGRMNQEWKGKRFDRRYCAELLDQRNYILQLSVTLWQDENLPEMCPRFCKFSPAWPYKALNWVTGTRGTFPPVIDTLWPALIKTFRVRTFRDNWVIYTRGDHGGGDIVTPVTRWVRPETMGHHTHITRYRNTPRHLQRPADRG